MRSQTNFRFQVKQHNSAAAVILVGNKADLVRSRVVCSERNSFFYSPYFITKCLVYSAVTV